MIDPASLFCLGNFGKPVGYKGMISLSYPYNLELQPGMFIFVKEDGLPVPWRVNQVKQKGDGYTIAFRGIESSEDVKCFTGAQAFVPTEYLPDTDDDECLTYDQLIGLRLFDGKQELGTVADVDDTTENVVLDVETADGRHILVPAADDFIDDIDLEQNIITMTLPEGLIDLN